MQAAIPDASHNPVAVTFNVTAWFSPGTFTAHPSIGIFRSDDTPIAIRTMTVTYQVAPQTPGVSTNSVAMVTQANNGAPEHHGVLVKGSGMWTATVEYTSGAPGWLKLNGSSTFPQTGPGGTMLDLWPDTARPAGGYAATLHVAIGGQTFDVAVTLDLQP